MSISDDLGALLWRRVYECHADLRGVVHINEDTLRALLEQAGVPEPDDDVILWQGKPVHGRGLSPVVREHLASE